MFLKVRLVASVMVVLVIVSFAFASEKDFKTALILSEVEVETEDDVSVASNGQTETIIAFKPTKEWQIIKPGQAVPRGLHVRLNLQTGEREAKLLDSVLETEPVTKTSDKSFDNNKAMDLKVLKEKLSNIKQDDVKETDTSEEVREQELLKKFKPYSELKKDFEELNVKIKTDTEILRELLAEYRLDNCSLERKIEIIQELEFYTHQIDNAQNFVDMGGLDIVKVALNSSGEALLNCAAHLLGSASQSNPKVQVAVVEHGILQEVLRKLAVAQSVNSRKKLFFALSSVIRHFPYAQKKFFELGGSEVLFNLLRNTAFGVKLRVKVVTLLSDLLMEQVDVDLALFHHEAESSLEQETSKLAEERRKQYREVPLLRELQANDWCKLLGELLLSCDDWDSQEKAIKAMHLAVAQKDGVICRGALTPQSAMRLAELKRTYQEVLLKNSEEENSDYIQSLLDHVTKLTTKLDFSAKVEL